MTNTEHIIWLASLAATLLGTESDSVATPTGTETEATIATDLTPRPSQANLRFHIAEPSDAPMLPDNWDPLDALPPSSPDRDDFTAEEYNFGLEFEWEEREEEEEDIDAEENNPCRGQKIEWVPGSIWETYAYAQHDSPFIGWTPIGFVGSKFIKIRSTSCLQALRSSQEIRDSTCRQCSNLLNSNELKTFMMRATEGAAPRTPWIYLTARQLKAMLVEVRKKLRRAQLEVHICIEYIQNVISDDFIFGRTST